MIRMCPDCKKEMAYEDERRSESGEPYDVKVYKCPFCKVEYDEDELDIMS